MYLGIQELMSFSPLSGDSNLYGLGRAGDGLSSLAYEIQEVVIFFTLISDLQVVPVTEQTGL